MSDPKISVDIDLNKKPAEKTAEAFRKDQQRLNSQLLTDAEATERAQTVIIERENRRRIDLIVAKAEGQKQEQAKSLTQVEVTEQAKTQAIIRENQRRVAAELSWLEASKGNTTKALTDVEIKEEAKSRIIKFQNEQRIQEIVKAATAEKNSVTKVSDVDKAEAKERADAARKLAAERIKLAKHAGDVEEDSLTKGQAAMGNMAKAVGSFGVQMLGLQSGQAIVSAMAESFAKARDIVLESVDSLKDYREQVLELAALKDDLGSTGTQVRDQILFRAKTLQTRGDADTFQKGFLGAAESIMDKPGQPGSGMMSDKDLKQFMEFAASFQAAEGGDANTHATLAGLIPQNSGKKRVTAKEAQDKIEKLYSIFKPGIFDSFSSAAGQYQKLTPMIMNKVYSDVEGAALMSAFSTQGAGAESGTMTEWFTRATVGAMGKKGVPRVENAEPIGEYYKELGVNNQMTPFQIGDLVTADMNKAAEAAAKRGEQFNAIEFLGQKGFGNDQDKKAHLAYRGAKNSGQMKTFFDIANDPSKGEAAAKIDEFQNRDMAGINRKVALEQEAADITSAAKTEYYDALMRHTYASYKARNPGLVTGTYEEYIKDNKLGGQRRLHGIASDMLADEYQRAGGTMSREAFQDDLNPGLGTFQAMGPLDMAERFNQVRDIIHNVGGNIMPGFDAVGEAAKAIDANKLPARPKPAAPGGVGPQAMFMGHRGAIASLLVSGIGDDMPGKPGLDAGGLPPAIVDAPRGSGGGGGVQDNTELIAALKGLTDAITKSQQVKSNAPPRPLVEPKPALRR